ncbi:MAG: TonB family protein [Nevskia sp.]|nr:TonB family protein [Nevskia sp.]
MFLLLPARARGLLANAEPTRTFETAAVKAVRDWTFHPATRGDGPVESHMKIHFDFKP